ncbi:MAG: hypothetical protein KDI88_14640 [Gammaproteobacteria bacterium]|nr:hypothetical protein [Gammaproteobacteria bacterium]
MTSSLHNRGYATRIAQQATRILALCTAAGIALYPVLCLANGYPPPPGPFPFAPADDAPAAAWPGPAETTGDVAPRDGFAPVDNGYPGAVRDPYSADTLFGAAPAMSDTPASDVPPILPSRDPGYAYPAAPYADGPTAGRLPRRADFSVDSKRDQRPVQEPAYGYPAADPQWHYPALPAGDMSMTAPYAVQPPIDYRSTTMPPAYGNAYPDAAYTMPPVADVARGGQVRQRKQQDGKPQQAPGAAITERDRAPGRTASAPVAPRGKSTGMAADADLFRPALEGQ